MFDLQWERQRKRRLFRFRKLRISKLKLWSLVATGCFIGLIGIVLFIGILFAWYAKDLPRPDKVKRSEGLTTVILDRNGQNLYDIFQEQNRIYVKWEDIPQYLKDATVAIEDKNFYKHQGLSTSGIIRAMVSTVLFRGMQGGSTLTQQLVKNVLLTSERTLPRKMKEAILAIQIERKYTKDEILQMYLNEAPYGGTAVGVEAAAEYYFGKPAKNLDLVESVILAGLPQAPSRYSPFLGEQKAYAGRAIQVLRRMREDGYISTEQETEARKDLESVGLAAANEGLRAPHFVAYVKELLEKKFGVKTVESGGLRVTTTLDWALQEKAQTIVKEEVEKAKRLQVGNGAAVVLDPKTGEILAMVGSKDYAASESGGFKYNVVTQGLRQPGSAIKPITYAAAFKKGYTAATMLMDLDTKYPSGDPAKPEYNPKNYDNKFRGPVQLRFALANSINTIAVKVSALVGVRDILQVASDMGISTLEPTSDNVKRLGLSLTLGGGEVTLLDLTSAFGVFATGGLRQDLMAILKVEDKNGKILFEHKSSSASRVLPADVAYLVSNILSDNDARKEVFGLNSYLNIAGKTVAAKTGTTDDKHDNWTVGYTPYAVVGTWVGNNDNSPMHPSLASGATGAAPIWNRIMREIVMSKPDEPFIRPDTIIEVEVDAMAGGLPVASRPTRKELFIKGTEPTAPSTIYKQVKVSKNDGNKLANDIEIAKGEYDIRNFIVIHEDDPASSDGKNRWQEPIDVWITTQSDPLYHPPTETYRGGSEVAVKITKPKDYEQVNSNSVSVTAETFSSNEIIKMEIFIDGSLVKEISGSKLSETITVSDGSHKIKVKASDKDYKTGEDVIKVGVNQPYSEATPGP